jgi:hypothetical protein
MEISAMTQREVQLPTAHAVTKLARPFAPEALATLVKLMRNAELPSNVRIKACEASAQPRHRVAGAAGRRHGATGPG